MRNGTKLFNNTDGTTFWEDIKAAIAKVPALILQLLGLAQELSKPIVEQAIEIANAVGEIFKDGTWSGDFLETLTASTPNPIDDKVLAWLRANWVTVIQELAGIPETIGDIEEATRLYFESLGLLTPARMEGEKSKLASIITQGYSKTIGVELSRSEADYIVQSVFIDSVKAKGLQV